MAELDRVQLQKAGTNESIDVSTYCVPAYIRRSKRKVINNFGGYYYSDLSPDPKRSQTALRRTSREISDADSFMSTYTHSISVPHQNNLETQKDGEETNPCGEEKQYNVETPYSTEVPDDEADPRNAARPYNAEDPKDADNSYAAAKPYDEENRGMAVPLRNTEDTRHAHPLDTAFAHVVRLFPDPTPIQEQVIICHFNDDKGEARARYFNCLIDTRKSLYIHRILQFIG